MARIVVCLKIPLKNFVKWTRDNMDEDINERELAAALIFGALLLKICEIIDAYKLYAQDERRQEYVTFNIAKVICKNVFKAIEVDKEIEEAVWHGEKHALIVRNLIKTLKRDLNIDNYAVHDTFLVSGLDFLCNEDTEAVTSVMNYVMDSEDMVLSKVRELKISEN